MTRTMNDTLIVQLATVRLIKMRDSKIIYLLVGNGDKLKILVTYSTKLNNPNLHNVLYVPKIT